MKMDISWNEDMKKRAGFTIIEVLLALFILVSSLYVLSGTQIRFVRLASRGRDEIDRVFLVKKEWLQVFINPGEGDKPVTCEYKEPDPDVKITTTLKKPAQSLLGMSKKKQHEDPLLLVTSEGRWQRGVFNEVIRIVGFIYKPEEKDEKKK